RCLSDWSSDVCSSDLRQAAHEWIGYAALAVVALRAAWGFMGPRYSRFGQFVRSPAKTLAYVKAVAAGREPRYLGHNPLGGWMVRSEERRVGKELRACG